MESLIDEIDSLVAPDLSAAAPDWCENCQTLRKDLKKLQDEQEQSFVKLKQKIISTDLLIKKYKSKCEDYDVQYKKNEESTKRADKFQRQSEILETQLKAALMDTEPLRTAKTSLELEMKTKNTEIQDLKHKLVIAEGAQRQYEHLNRSTTSYIEKLEADTRELNTKIKVLESGKVSKEATKELKAEISALKKENTGLRKTEKQLERKLKSALSKIESLTERLKENKMSPRQSRRRTTSGSLLSPVRSPSKSPRVRKISPNTSPKKPSQKSSLKLSRKVEDTDTIDSSDISSEDDSEDDVQSVFSMKWTFSPVMQCLSPLPPSPACLKSLQKQKSLSDMRMSDVDDDDDDDDDDDNLSDMAEELEQQLLGELPSSEDVDKTEVNADQDIDEERSDTPKFPKSEQGIDFKNEVDLENKSIVKTKILVKGGVQIPSSNSSSEKENTCSAILEQPADIVGSKTGTQVCIESQSVVIQTNSTKDMVDVISKITTNSAGEIEIKTDSDGETHTAKPKLAASSEIMSLGKVRSRKSHLSCSTDSRGEKVDLEYSDSLQSLNVKSGDSNSERHGNQDAKIEDDVSNDTLIRNDTLEFDPIISEDTGIGIEKETVKDSEECKEISYINKPCDTNAKRKDNSNFVNSECSASLIVESEDAGRKIPSVSDGKDIDGGEFETNKKEIVTDETLPKTQSLPRVLKRQECVDKKRDLEKQSPHGSESVPLMITFPKGSHGMFEEEIENLQDTNDYTVLTRETSHKAGGSRHSKKLKNIKKKIKSTCKFKDLDSVHETSFKQEQEDIALAFVKHKHGDSLKTSCDIKVKRNEMDASGQEKVDNTSVSQLPMSYESNTGTDTITSCAKIEDSTGSNKQDNSQSELVSESIGNIGSAMDVQIPVGTIENTCEQEALTVTSTLGCPKDMKSEGTVVEHMKAPSPEKNTTDDTQTTKIWLCIATSPETATTDSELNNVTMMLESNTAGIIPVIDSDKTDTDTSEEFMEGKASLCPSRQMSTGFVVNQSSVERTPSIDGPVSNLPFVNTICDKEGVKLRKAACPVTRQANINSCDTIKEESEVDEDNTLVDDKSDVILGIDDILADEVDLKQNSKEQHASLSSLELTKHEVHLSKGKEENVQNKTDILNNEMPDSLFRQYSDDTTANRDEERNSARSELHAQSCLDYNNRITKSFIDKTNKPGCSYQYENSTITPGVTLDSDIVTVTSTTSLTTTSCRLTSSPDNLDFESLTVCQSLSRSTTPSVCSVDMATAPLSPLSISPFDFIIPISPLPPSPVRQVDRVSPLSPEQPAEILEKSTEVSETVIEDDTPNENEKNAGNIPQAVTPKKPILEKVIEFSPLPDLISPVKTPKQLGAKHEKKKKVKQKLASVSTDVNIPVKFGSGVPTGVLTVKPKLESKALIKDLSNNDTKPGKCDSVTVVSNTEAKLSISKFDKFASKDLSLRKHVILKKKIDLVTHDESVFQRKHGREKQVSKDVNKEIKTKTSSVAQSVTQCVQEDSSLIDKKETHTCDASKNKAEDIKQEKKSIDATGDAKHEVNKIENSTTDLQMDSKGDMDERQVNQTENKVITGPDVVPAGYDPLLASKRKTRMAHQPRSHQHIVRKPPVIIDPLPQGLGTRRKRKSHDSSVKDVIPKKMAKGTLFQKGKAESDTDSISYENTRKMEVFLTSSEKEQDIFKTITESPAGITLGQHMVETCLECIGRLRVELLDLAHVYNTCNSGSYLSVNEDLPFLNDVEKKAMNLITCISQNTDLVGYIRRKHQGFVIALTMLSVYRVKTWTFNDISVITEDIYLKFKRLSKGRPVQQGQDTGHDTILKTVWEKIFTKELTVTMVGKMSLARLFTATCLKEGDVEHVRVMLHNIATCGFLNLWLFVIPVVNVWPEVLRKTTDSLQDNTHTPSMLIVLEYIVTKSLVGQGTESGTKALKVLEKLCNWSGSPDSPEAVLKILTTRLFDFNSEQPVEAACKFEVVKACKLLLMSENWPWCKEHFINRQGLQPAYNRYLCKKGTGPSDYECAILDITGSITTFYAEAVKHRDLQQICKTWLIAMLSKQPGDPVIQRKCLDTLIELSVLNPTVLCDLHTWFTKNPDSVFDGYLPRLEVLRQAYEDKFGLVCDSFLN